MIPNPERPKLQVSLPDLGAYRERGSDGHRSAAGHGPGHIVQFYEDDSLLADCVVEFLAPGVSKGAPIVVVATRRHLDLIREKLDEYEFFNGQLVLLDAAVTLEKFMVGPDPDTELFLTHVGGILEQARAIQGSDTTPRIFGEMVDILWRDGNSEAAIRLEELWNELRQKTPFHLMCGYHIGAFSENSQAEGFSRVCSTHAQVHPAESYPEVSDPQARLREVTRLQQRERALQTELAYRKKLEEAQRQALAELRLSQESERESQKALQQSVDDRERLIEKLQRTVRFSELFLGVLGHDLRNPLNAIVTSASLLRRRAEDEKLTRPIGRILSSADRMARMIDQLLDFTQIRLGTGIRLNFREFDLQGICQAVLEELETGEDASSIEFRFEGNPSGFGDPDRLAQLISNLAGNALHHRAPGRPVTVHIDGTNEGRLRLSFQNEGTVPAELVPVMFEPFHGDSQKKSSHSSGLGLGLFVSQQIVQAHGGTITLDSTEASGTTVTVDLPRRAVPGAADRLFGLQQVDEGAC